jgi:hypothetical protein
MQTRVVWTCEVHEDGFPEMTMELKPKEKHPWKKIKQRLTWKEEWIYMTD